MRDRDLVDNFFLLLLLLPQLPYISCFGACTFIQSWNIFSMNKLLYMCALDFNLKFTCILFYILFMHSLINLHWLFCNSKTIYECSQIDDIKKKNLWTCFIFFGFVIFSLFHSNVRRCTIYPQCEFHTYEYILCPP